MAPKDVVPLEPDSDSDEGAPKPYVRKEYAKWSDNLTDRWESPFSKWTEEDWKTRKFPTRAELKAVIPPHCFERSALAGFYFIARDCVVLLSSFYLYSLLGWEAAAPETAFGWLVWAAKWFLYAFVQGGLSAGLWVMGHECGHGAFSEYPLLNDFVGWVLHSAFLVPYFSWQYSHAKHHRRTNDVVDGETHTPELITDNWCSMRYRLYKMIGYQAHAIADVFIHLNIFYPGYFSGVLMGGRLDYKGDEVPPGAITDHFRPNSLLFPPKMRLKVLFSDLGIAITLALCYWRAQYVGYLPVLCWYIFPVISMNHGWLVFITWMQHTHPTVPHLGDPDWTWVKGAIVGTIDRPDPLIDFVGHKIGSTHVCHHLFHEIPFYHAEEATEALRTILEPLGMYNFDPTHQAKAMYLASKHCHYMESTTGIQFYKSFKYAYEQEQKQKQA